MPGGETSHFAARKPLVRVGGIEEQSSLCPGWPHQPRPPASELLLHGQRQTNPVSTAVGFSAFFVVECNPVGDRVEILRGEGCQI